MATKTTTTVLARARKTVGGGGRAEVTTDREVVRLTERYLELRRQAFRDAVDTAIELGEIVLEVARRAEVRFSDWLDEVGTAERSARNYAGLAMLAQEEPGIIQAWKELGPSKLYRVARLPPAARRSVLQSSAAEKLTEATDREFAEIVAPYVKKHRKVTADMRAHGLRMRVLAWTKAIRSARVKGIRDDGLRDALDAELGELVRGIEALRRQIG